MLKKFITNFLNEWIELSVDSNIYHASFGDTYFIFFIEKKTWIKKENQSDFYVYIKVIYIIT